MASAIRTLTAVQVGKESSPGTAVAATRRLALRSATYRRIVEEDPLEDLISGGLSRTAAAPVRTRNHTELEIAFPLDFDQILLPLLSGVKGGVTPSGPETESEDDRTWTFTPAFTGDPACDPYTLQFAERSPADTAGMAAPYGLTQSFRITGGDTGTPTVSCSMFARRTTDTAPTNSLAVPLLDRPANGRWNVYFDTEWDNLGNTHILGQVYGFQYEFRDNIRPGFYLDSRSDLDFSQPEVGQRVAEVTFDVVHDPATSKLVQTQMARKEAGQLVWVRCAINGPVIPDTTGDLTKFVRLDGAYYHAADSMTERGSDRDGNLITRVHLLSALDPTEAKDIEISVRNTLTAFPSV